MSNHALLLDEDFREDCRSAERRDEVETVRCVCGARVNKDDAVRVNGKWHCFSCYMTTCDECGRETTVDDDHLCYTCARPELHAVRQ